MDITEHLENISSRKNRYIIILTFVTFLLWTNTDMLLILLPYLQKMPTVVIFDLSSGFSESELTYDLCVIPYEVTKFLSHSWVYSMEIQCSKVLVSLMSSSVFFGLFLGSIFFNQLADEIGRKKTFIIATFGYGVVLLAYQLPQNVTIFFILNVLGGYLVATIICNSIVLISETVKNKYRAQSFGVINSGFAFCGVVYISILWATDNWQLAFGIATCFCVILTLVIHIVIVESPKFYLMKGNWLKYIMSLRMINERNNRLEQFDKYINYPQIIFHLENASISDSKLVEKINETSINWDDKDEQPMESLIEFAKVKRESTANEAYGVLDFFKFPSQKWNIVVCIILFFVSSCSYYGFSIYIKKLQGNIYFNGIILYFMEAFAYLLFTISADFKILGRKYATILYYVAGALFYFVLHFFKMSPNFELLIAVLCKVSVATGTTLNDIWISEIFPTKLRASAAGICKAAARIGGVLTPFIIEFLPNHSSLVYCLLLIFMSSLLIVLPETLGKQIPLIIPEEEVDEMKEPFLSSER